MMQITDLCAELKNWFETSKYLGRFEIKNGKIGLSDLLFDNSLQKDQYFRIIGSVFNDGVYQYSDDLSFEQDEKFSGAIWPMRLPKEIVELAAEIDDWCTKNADALNSPYQSESFGGYTYSKGSYGNNQMISWQNQFANKLNRWRKI